MTSGGRDALFALSTANLAYVRVWQELIFEQLDPHRRYLTQNAVTPVDYVAAMLNVLLIAVALYVACRAIRSTTSGPARKALLLIPVACVLTAMLWMARVLNLISNDVMFAVKHVMQDWPLVLPGLLCLTVVVSYLGARSRVAQVVRKSVVAFFIVLSPFCLATFGQSLYLAVMNPYEHEFQEQASAPTVAAPPARRVVVLLFDELDYRLIFEERPPRIALPELDRFRAASFAATAATSPSNSTTYAIPALLTGKMTGFAKTVAANDIRLAEQQGGAMVSWASVPTIFSRVRQAGGNSGLAGWWHPYHRVVKKDLAVCHVHYLQNLSRDLQARSVPPRMASQFLSVTTFPTVVGNKALNLAVYPAIINEAIELSTNPLLQVVFVHFPYPHAPFVFDMDQERIERMKPDSANYFGNVVLVDRTLRRVHEHMERAGLWDKSMVIVTSDHWWRSSPTFDSRVDQRVPFMVKLPGATRNYVYGNPFNTVVMHDLITAFLGGAFSDVTQLAAWVDLHGKRIEPVFKDETR